MMVRGEPDYADQIPRRLEYEATHPATEIIYISPWWQAIIRKPEDAEQTIITRHSLKSLLDKLESMDEKTTAAMSTVMNSAHRPTLPGPAGLR